MKLFKKLMSYFIALTMVLSLATLLGGNVHAAEATTYKLTLTGTASGHTYEAYQVFTGDLSTNKQDKKVLSNVRWGTGVTYTQGKDEQGKVEKKSAADVAKDLGDGTMTIDTLIDRLTLTTPAATKDSSAPNTEITGLAAGYYLVKDKDGSQKDTQDAYTTFIVQVVGPTEVKVKSDVPTVEKKVQDKNDSTGDTSGWQDSADYDIGDWVPYQITGSMPNNIADYTTYKYEFTDTMDPGLTYNKDDAQHKANIKIGNKDVTGSFTETVANTDGKTTVTWTCNNLKGIEGVTLDKDTKVVVTYSARLNENAVIGAAGNPNTVDLTYSNNPNKGGDGETGKTPKDKNIVFTYKTVFNKVDQDGGALAGADFKLEKFINGQWSVLADSKSNVKFNDEAIKSNEGKTFTFKGLDDGIYRLVETTTPDGYNTMKPLEFKITADHTNDPATLELTSLTMEKMTALNDSNDQTLSNNVAGTESNGIMTTDVVNKSGSTLPSTGGMGTTLLYVAGGILVACAAAYVVLNKKRA